MIPEIIDTAARALAAGGSRRAALGALCGAVLTALLPEDGLGRLRKTGDREKRGGGAKRRHGDGKNRDGKQKKGKKDTSKGCKDNHSEKEILAFIAKAAKKYNQSESAMVRVAHCESTLDPCAYSKSGPYYGLFQFLKSTWKSTPYGNKNIYDPKAQALAAGWMWKQGRKNEWACK